MKEIRWCGACGAKLVEKNVADKMRWACPSEGCGYVHYDNPMPVLAAIVEHDGKVLLVRNKGWPDKWFGLVTGFLEKDETPEAGMLRELREELGLDGEIKSLIGVYPFVERNEVIIAYHVVARGEIRVGEELEGFKAIEPAKLRSWPFGTGLAVTDWLNRRAVTSARSG